MRIQSMTGYAAACCAAAMSVSPARGQVSDCGTEITPVEAAELARLEPLYQAAPQVARGEPFWVAVTMHIIRRTDGTGGLPADSICEGMGDMDEMFSVAGIQFFMSQPIDYIDSDAFYFDVDTLSEINVMRTMNWVPNTINIYFTPNLAYENGSLCGISAFTSSSVQSIAMRNSCMPPTNHSTLSHEVGHYFNLYHTHESAFGDELVNGSNCSVAGDVVCDTPADPTLGTGNVGSFPGCIYVGGETDPNGDPYAPNTKNLMSYSRKECRDHFSASQQVRSNTTLVNLRSSYMHEVPNGPPTECSACADIIDGDVNNDGQIDIFDILCELDGFIGVFTTCPLAALDVACPPDAVIDVFDILAVLDAFAGEAPCACGG
ncbi:MAG: hypothetical protein HOP29_11970 [Phycisphaerales bacterium]|nr:hypothetical protein [Phycisphaerales bacterium]